MILLGLVILAITSMLLLAWCARPIQTDEFDDEYIGYQ